MRLKYFLDVLTIPEFQETVLFPGKNETGSKNSESIHNRLFRECENWNETDTCTQKDRPVFLARACFIGIPVGHFSHFLGPTKSFYSLLTVPLILLDSWWLLVWPKHPKNTFAACFRTFSGALVAWPTRKSESMRQKYFLDVLTHPVTLEINRFLRMAIWSKHPKNTFAAYFCNHAR